MKIFSGLLLVSLLPNLVASLPLGFIAEVVTSTSAVSGIFAPNPRQNGKPMLIVIQKEGQVKVLENPDDSPDSTTILDLSDNMCTETERGLHSLTVHPDFEVKPYVYLYYTKLKEGCIKDDSDNGPWNVLSMFMMNTETLKLDYDSRVEIWRGAPTHDAVHNGGGLFFGNDGKIYLTTGDSGTQENAQDLQTVHGSVIRLNEDGSIPDDNPFSAANGFESYECVKTDGKIPSNVTSEKAVCAEIFANGLRNPFRVAVDPSETEKVRFAISDVGARVWEEISYAGTDYKGRNYGYKTYEGPCKRHSDSDCPVPDDPNFVDPFHYYLHREDKSGCVSGAAFVPEGVWPEEYKFLFADYVFQNVYTLIEDPDNECRTCSPPVPRSRNETFYESIKLPSDGKNQAKIVDIFFGPYKDTQALYVVRFGKYDTVIRIKYTGVMNSPPVVNFEFDDSRGYEVGEAVVFDGSGSSDPEGNPLVFKWFFGDGNESNEISPTHVYENTGEYTVTLFVEDSLKQVQQLSKTVSVGDPPVVTILSPAEGDQFYVGQVLTVQGEAFHLNGTAFADSELVWEVRKHHDDHFHPYLDPINGNDIDLSPGPKPEDLYASTNSFLEVILYAKDTETGLTGKAVRLVQPMIVSVGIDSYPPGLIIRVDDEPVTAYQTIVSWEEHELELLAEEQPPFTFVAWSDGSISPSRTIRLNYSEPAITAVFCAENEGTCTDDLECCSETCFRGVCASERTTTISPAPTAPSLAPSLAPSSPITPENTLSTSEDSPSPSLNEKEGDKNGRDINATTTTFFVVIGIAAIVAGAVCFARRAMLRSQPQSNENPEADPKEGAKEQAQYSADEESPRLASNHLVDDPSAKASNESKTVGGTVVTQGTAQTSND